MAPTLEVERALLARVRAVVGVDEVGRGALAGPVCVGAVALDAFAADAEMPPGLDDSKRLSEGARRALLGPLAGWGAARALGWATAREVDECGITGALRRAAMRALERIGAPDAVVILDGTHDWLTPPPATLDGVDEGPTPFHAVVTKVRADSACATVAAASVQAKCARDEHMAQLDAIHPGYGWASNKGYGSAGHLAAIRELGPSAEHRLTWRLDGRLAQPGCGAEGKMASLHAAARANSPSRRGES